MKILEWLIYLVVFCLPMYLVRFKIFGLPTNVLEVIIGTLFITWIIKKIKSPANSTDRHQPKVKIKDLNLFIPIILILIGVTITTIFSWDLRTSAGIWKGWFVVPLLFFIVLIDVFKYKKKQVKNILFAFILSTFIVAIISLIYLVQGTLDPTGRLQGFYNSPNYLAMYLAPALLISFWCYFFTFLVRPSEANSGLSPSLFPPAAGNRARSGLKTRSKTTLKTIKTILLIVNCSLLIVILFFTKSVGAWMGIIGGLGLGLFLYLQNLDKKKLAWLVIILGAMLVLSLVYLKGFVLPQGGRSFDARFVIWQKALEVFKTYPVIGIGPGTFEDYFPLYPKWGVPQPHNIFLAFLIQTGIIGFVGFIWLLIWFFKTGLKSLITDYGLRITLIMVMTYILIHGLVDTLYWKNDLAVVFWLTVGLMAVLKKPL